MPSTSPARLSAKPDSVLIVALSARSLALAAARAGYRAAVIDLFGDVDTRRLAERSITVPGDLGHGFEAEALIEAARKLAPAKEESSGLVYGSGLESRPELLERLARGRRLWGNRPSVLRAIKDPAIFFDLLDRQGLPHPEVRTKPPGEMADWLVKGIGGAGGGHVRHLAAGETGEAALYYQRRVPGRPLSCLILADGREATLLGWSEQWPDPEPRHPFRFGGAVQPAVVPPKVARAVAAALGRLVRETGIVGLNSLDLLVDEDSGFNVLEVNPRPGASLDVFDGEGAGALFGRHAAACEGRLFAGWQPPSRATAMCVVYADRPLDVPSRMSWPPWLADRPAPGAHIAPGAPVCTVMAKGSGAAATRALALARNRAVLTALAAGQSRILVKEAE